ncbi:hypothetical protein ACIG5E_16635 [Kitasatospora sp. NPDC053057]|uniref:hypothetical protein n=1 Tax=Kitasatospora sp. NPDC053057 TaxID=3364062 RepID=UPI0037C9E649
MIHDSADVAAAQRHWVEVTGIAAERFGRMTLKRHSAKTARRNTGDGYRGCLVVGVLGGADLYRRIEGWWIGIADTQSGGHSGSV